MPQILKKAVVFLIAAAALLLCGCVYFNTYFNAQKAYDQALRMREKRISKNPEDTTNLSADERAKLERAITKCSKVLELYPDKIEYAAKALFLMGESYLLMGEYDNAVEKYDELARYYPKAPQLPLAAVHRARGLYLGGQGIKARTAVVDILRQNPKGEILREAMLLVAKMEVQGDSASVGLDYYEKLLLEKDLAPEVRADVHWEAAQLAFGLKQWDRARNHALCEERKILPDRTRYRNERLALLCLYGGKKFKQGIEEAKGLSRKKAYVRFQPDLNLLIATGYEGMGDWKTAEKLYRDLPEAAPRTAVSAEAYYHLGQHFLEVLHREDSAQAYFDSSAAMGQSFEYGALSAEKSRALVRIAELRKANPDSTTKPHYSNFIIAELFLFNLSNVDSALGRLDTIVRSPVLDSTLTIRAAYARAYIQEEFKKDTAKSNADYRYVMEKFPNTEWAKQAEKNLGLKPTVQTDADKSHTLFLTAEKLSFGGADVSSQVVPAYREVVRQYPNTPDAGKALFVIAFLREGQAHQTPPVRGSLDSAKVAYYNLKVKYPETEYGRIASQKMENVDLPKSAIDSLLAKPKVDSSAAIAPAETPAEADTSEEASKKRKEVLEPKYENVDEY